MSFTQEEIAEFEAEAGDLFDSAEKGLLAIDRGEAFATHYDAIFRTFHSIKGASGMMEMMALQSHMHQLENILIAQKDQATLAKVYLDLFLKGLDAARSILAGGTVNFDFTIHKDPPPPPAPVRAAPVEPNTDSLGRIIVVDDEPDLVELLTDILRDSNFEVTGTTESAKVLELVKSFKPDLVVTDIMMPIMDGMQVLGVVKKHNPDLPVIFVSGHVSKESLLEAIALGVFGVIEKPFDVKHIVATCRQAVRRHRVSALLNKSINLIMYQFSDLNEYLKAQGKEDIRKVISTEIGVLLDQRRLLRQPN
jgi:DNA-binding response OmpR family regulator/HPt (histidine-containing phosphotransfer) domain-containing protein